MPSTIKSGLLTLLSAGALTGAAPVSNYSASVMDEWTTIPTYPSPETEGLGGWETALVQAKNFTSELTLQEKIFMVTGVDGPCAGNIPPIWRLGFSGLCLQDGPLAIRQADYASAFPAGLSAAASWDLDLIKKRGVLMADEFKGKGSQVALGPVAGPLGRKPLSGRNWEGFSPDEYLTGKAFAETIVGMQSSGVQACGKHFIGNEQETQRNPSTIDNITIDSVSANIDDRTMHELYLWPFADGVKAGLSSVMCSYNRVNNTHSCQNSKMLNGLLKEELGFQGYVMSDWDGTHAGVDSINAGLDMDQPGFDDEFFGESIKVAVNNGSIDVSRLNDMINRIMTPYFLLGQDVDFPSVDPSSVPMNGMLSYSGYEEYADTMMEWGWDLNGTSNRDVRDDHATFIRKLGAESAVLLKNVDGALPLAKPKTIGVFGNGAPDATWGLYPANIMNSYGTVIGAQAIGGGSGSARLTNLVSPLEAIKAKGKEDGAFVQYVTNNSVIEETMSSLYPVPEVCLVFIKAWATEGYDRYSYAFDNEGAEAVTAVAGTCNNTIVVTTTPGQVDMPFVDNENVTAIIAFHMPGEEMGNSMVDVLYGDVNPSGHLPYTIAKDTSDYASSVAIVNLTESEQLAGGAGVWEDPFTEALFIDYKYFDAKNITPQYAFGYGLSYTTFELSDIVIEEEVDSVSAFPDNATVVPGGNPNLYTTLVHVNATLSNTGSVAGATVPQLYLYYPDSAPSGTPVKVLRGFAKASLEAGASTSVEFDLTRKDFSNWNVAAQDWEIASGEFTLGVGLSSDNIEITGTVTLL
ncbi:MAG: hypothetical protein M1834_008232 [Cirrosporium novae-zelandiae]|nr:MAG: hypothetical protein M1834_008232 [Cirrosporium novae-zelandiae]